MPGYCNVLLISVYLLKATFSVCGIVCKWKLLSVLVKNNNNKDMSPSCSELHIHIFYCLKKRFRSRGEL